ncbi:hypothetical protein QBC38DRAFT_50342 [Podospora fimiseda]|uniref:Uncharacterized protein n=1 Tax=Podospora fimiseda TaxID=252190 RepID=A0AAN7BV77_9PEZI|nr:hypothetical protein QBC38DRAFT_50342 [Podospora fimiseda]
MDSSPSSSPASSPDRSSSPPAPSPDRSSSPPAPSPSPQAAPVSPSPSSPQKPISSSHRRQYSLYDAVAGRIYPPEHPLFQSTHKTTPKGNASPTSKPRRHSFSKTIPPFTPEEALLRRKNAPGKWIEYDTYWASEDLEGTDVRLPESELLVCLHSYVSKFYDLVGAGKGTDKRLVDERSMDETALLAIGILLEEAGREVLGKRGGEVFVEGEVEEKVVEAVVDEEERKKVEIEGEPEEKKKGVKRRKLSGKTWEQDEEMEI